MKLTPAHDVVVIEAVEEEIRKITKGTVLEVVAEKAPEIGRVLAIGEPGKKKQLPYPGMKVGDVVAYRRFGENTFMIEGKEVYFIIFDDILGKIEVKNRK